MADSELKISGDREIERMLDGLPDRAQQRVMKSLLREAIKVVAAAERSEAPDRTGLLRQAVGESLLRSYAAGRSLFITAGVRWGYRRTAQLVGRGKRRRLRYIAGSRPEAGGDTAIDPARYQYPLMKGRKAVAALNGSALHAITGRFFARAAEAPGKPFIERAFAAAGPAAVAAIEGRAPELILAEASALLHN